MNIPQLTTCLVATLLAWSAPHSASAAPQQRTETKTSLRFDHFRDWPTMLAEMKELEAAFPTLFTVVEIGRSAQDRPIVVGILEQRASGDELDKPAMYIDGNIHGNEIQAAETVLYSAWYLLEYYGKNAAITELVDRSVFYFVPSANPDGRQNWFDKLNTSSSARTGQAPTDDDRDGVCDEDGPDDINGDGSVGQMWRRDPTGPFRPNELDPDEMEYIAPEVKSDGSILRGGWSMAGMEGIDNDGDGLVNEDGTGGYDLNRNWPADWHPEHVQGGAGDWPFSHPESRAIGAFIRTRSNIAAGQAYHNAGGMILRGPGAATRDAEYPQADRAVYESIAKTGENLLPGYRSMVIHSDLYPVRGGFVNWLAESLGVVSFTNELWTDKRVMQNGQSPTKEQSKLFEEKLRFESTRTPLTKAMHPTHGEVLVGGSTKWDSRIPPSWMLEEECHRNFAFTMHHAGEMPRLHFIAPVVKRLGETLWQVDFEIQNDALIPSRTARAADKHIGMPDRLVLTVPAEARVVASGFRNGRFDLTFDEQNDTPATLDCERGVPSRGSLFTRFLVEGKEGAPFTAVYRAEKATDRSVEGTLREAATP
ncbi:MAG: peptidase M14 [Phycisphaerales bacterium]|nr:peptidase M14 [Phycisphaerales bacterium]